MKQEKQFRTGFLWFLFKKEQKSVSFEKSGLKKAGRLLCLKNGFSSTLVFFQSLL